MGVPAFSKWNLNLRAGHATSTQLSAVSKSNDRARRKLEPDR
jgi:hypothetical protein